MKKKDLEFWLKRTRQLLLRPRYEWQKIVTEERDPQSLFRFYFLPACLFSSLLLFIGCSIQHNLLYATGFAIINLLSAFGGIYVVYLLTREYLNGKMDGSDNTALILCVYSAVIFILFHSLSLGLGNNFFGQLTGVISLLFLRTLYTGIYFLEELPVGLKTNLFIIMSLSVIFIPVILSRLLMILFHIPVFNL